MAKVLTMPGIWLANLQIVTCETKYLFGNFRCLEGAAKEVAENRIL